MLFNEGKNVEFKIAFTTRCSAACTTCLNNNIKNHFKLDTELFRKLILQIIDLDIKNNIIVSFYSIGESYLHPDFLSCCEWAIPRLKQKGVKTCIVTNGSHVTAIPKGIDTFIFSFNAGTKETYEKITKMSFDKVYNNIFSLYRKGEFKKAKSVQIHMLCFDENKGEEKKFIKLFKGMKGVKYRFGYKYDNQFGDTEHAGRETQYKNARRIPCDYVTNKVTVYPNGDIVRCSHDFFCETKYGNLKENSLKEILLGNNRQNVFRQHICGKYDGLCRNCDYNMESSGVYVYGMFHYGENIYYQTGHFIMNCIRKMKAKFI